MNINIKAKNIELTNAIEQNVKDRLESVSKLLNNSDALVNVEVGKTTNHHNNGDIFLAEFDVSSSGENYFARTEGPDLYVSINDTKEQILKEIRRKRGRKTTLFKRGALSIKKMVKGISKRNPFTSKY